MTKTELHTHLMGMLSAEGFLNFLASFDYEMPLLGNGEINFESSKTERIPVKKLMGYDKVIEQISIKYGNKVSYGNLEKLYYVRSMLLKDLIAILNKDNDEDNKVKVYSKYLEESLKELIAQKVEYVEISFSNAKVIDEIMNNINPNITKNIKCKFLVSTDRSNVEKEFKKSARCLENLVNKGCSVGFDIMGSEIPLTALDLDKNSKLGFYKKLIPLVETLHKLKHTTLRIHSGETYMSDGNTEKILHILEDVENDLGISLPPPFIRIGHGVHFRKDDEYIRLLQKFKCIVEINATSNYALSNINKYYELPYNYYLNNGIPIVISSDGHGLYDTTKQKEDSIASAIATKENNEIIEYIDSHIADIKKNR